MERRRRDEIREGKRWDGETTKQGRDRKGKGIEGNGIAENMRGTDEEGRE